LLEPKTHANPLELVLLEHGVEGLIGEDEVVQHGDAQQLACALEAFGDIAVVRAWHQVPAGVVVGDDDGGGPLTQGVGEDLHPSVTGDTIKCTWVCVPGRFHNAIIGCMRVFRA